MGNEKEAPGTCPGCLWPGEMSSPALLACCHGHSSCRHRPRLGILSPKHFVLLRKMLCVCGEIFIDILPECLQQGCAGAAGVLKLVGIERWWQLGAEGCSWCFWQGRFGASPGAEGSPAGQSPEKSSVRYFWPSEFQSSLNDFTVIVESLGS